MKEAAFQELVKLIRANDKRGLQQVFDQTYRYCTRTLIKKTRCSAADAEDIYMDALLVFRENILSGRLTILSNLKTYMYGICFNLWRTLNRHHQKQQQFESEIARQYALLTQEGAEQTALELTEKANQVKAALKQLSETCQQLLTLVYLEQRPQEEIAQIMGFASSNVVKVTRHRCYKYWMKALETQAYPNG
ncbi:MAG: sigma-70 family RNA polymerase sigma factor [Bacteroidota bacterium]